MRRLVRLRSRFLGGLIAAASSLAVAAEANVPVPRLIAIPAGEFSMGSEAGASWERPVHRVHVSAYTIGVRPVSNAEFRAFQPAYRNPIDDEASAAVRGVSWVEASRYTAWLSETTGGNYRLPTEAEWERAARGDLEQKKYPWGDEPPVPEDKLDSPNAWPAPRPNALGFVLEYEPWEWTADYYGRDYYQESPARDPKGPAKGEFRVLRGGSYPNDPNSMSTYSRGSARPQTAAPNITFRVASDAGATVVSEARPSAAPDPPTRPATPVASATATETAPEPTQISPETGALASLEGVEIAASGGEMILTLTVVGTPEIRTMELQSPDRVVLDLRNTTIGLRRSFGERSVAQLGVSGVRWAPFESGVPTVRVVLDLERAMEYSVDSQPGRITVRLRL